MHMYILNSRGLALPVNLQYSLQRLGIILQLWRHQIRTFKASDVASMDIHFSALCYIISVGHTVVYTAHKLGIRFLL